MPDPQDPPPPQPDPVPPERLWILETALRLGAEEDAARLRMRGWAALWLGVAFAYLIIVAWLRRGIGPADGFVLCFVAGASALFILYEWRQAWRSRDLLGLLLAPAADAKA